MLTVASVCWPGMLAKHLWRLIEAEEEEWMDWVDWEQVTGGASPA